MLPFLIVYTPASFAGSLALVDEVVAASLFAVAVAVAGYPTVIAEVELEIAALYFLNCCCLRVHLFQPYPI